MPGTKQQEQIMRKSIIVKAQYTIAQYLAEVIENKVVFNPYEKYRLLIDPKYLGLFKADYKTERDYFNHAIEAYIRHIENIGINFYDSNNNLAYIRQVNRTINRLIKALEKHKTIALIDWAIIFYMPVYGIDIQRQNADERKKESKGETGNDKKSAHDLLCLAYQLDEKKSCNQNAFFSLEAFSLWLSSKAVKGKDIRLQTVSEAKLIDDTLVNSDDAIEYIKRTLERNKPPFPDCQ